MSKRPHPATFASMVLLLAGLLLLGGCRQTVDPLTAAMAYPPDLAISVFVDAPWVGDDDALTTRATYILLPDRRLHAAYGPGVTPQFFPPATATVSQPAMAHLWQLIELFELRETHGLDEREATTRARERVQDEVESVQEDDQEITVTDTVVQATRELAMYRVQIIAHNRSHIYVVDQSASMGTEFLIRELADLRGWTRRVDGPVEEEAAAVAAPQEQVMQSEVEVEVEVEVENPAQVPDADGQ